MSGMIRAELILLWDERLGRWPPEVLAPRLEVREAFQNDIKKKNPNQKSDLCRSVLAKKHAHY